MAPGKTATARSAPARAAAALGRRVRRHAGLAPRRPAGWMPGPPDFVGVGAQRAGTKWWYRLVCDHPNVEPGPGKEVHFFDRFCSRELEDGDVHAYHRLFPRPPGALTGEWTPRYMHDFWTPALLARAAPEARILVLLRDPWDRYLSGLAHEHRVLRRELRRGRAPYLTPLIAGDALARSLYHDQVVRLLDSFDRSQLLFLQYERCVENPAAELRRTYEFLGLEDADHVPATLTARTGRSSVRPEVPGAVRRVAARTIAADARQLDDLLPEIDLSLWPSLRESPPGSGPSSEDDARAARVAS